jgi:hypothetical protein
MIARWLIVVSCLVATAKAENGGAISGVVLDASNGRAPLGGIEVILRARVGGEDVICDRTVTDDQGRFAFERLPVGEGCSYTPGANRDGVHYPGERVRLSSERPRAEVELAACEAVSQPNPLVIRRQDVFIRSVPGALIVTEKLMIDNPSGRCYVGVAQQAGGEPITLQLGVPENFQRTTFDEEFYGRRFRMVAGKLTTSIPWTPGQRELKFTYTVPLEQGASWQRPLDLPCESIRVSVNTERAGDVQCNLPAAAGVAGEAVFESCGGVLQPGYMVRVEMGSLPAPMMCYGRWIAVGTLIVMFIIAGIASIGRNRPAGRGTRCGRASEQAAGDRMAA